MFKPTRRSFLKYTLGAGAACGASRLGFSGALADSYNEEVLVVLFLRGGCDGLSLVPPVGGPDRALYESARPGIAVPLSGSNAAISLDGNFGLHSKAAPLLPLWQDGKMAIVHAVGMHHPTRSHFEAEDYIEMGTPGSKSVGSGWLYRHLNSAENLPSEILIPAVSAGYYRATSLLGCTDSLTLADADYFEYLWGSWQWQNAERFSQRRLYEAGESAIHGAGLQAMNAVDIIQAYAAGEYTPAGGAVYPSDELGDLLELAARLIKAQLGVRVITIDYGGWDTHEGQGWAGGGFFAELVRVLAEGLSAFYTDISASGFSEKMTLVGMTEFGRRVEENADAGTDHGHAAPMLLLGDHVVGGFHGSFAGLQEDEMFEGIDVEVTTDYRRILSEILIRRMGNPRLGKIFPGYTDYSPLGVVEGADLPPDYSDGTGELFRDGFEIASTGRWSAVVGSGV